MTSERRWPRSLFPLLAAAALLLGGCTLVDYAVTNAANAQNRPNTSDASRAQTTAMAYQVQFDALYAAIWNFGWFGYKDANYSPGQGTVWQMSGTAAGSKEPVTFERAFLRLNGDQTQWWRLTLRGGKAQGGEMVYEFLVGADTEVRKVRYKDPESGAIGEFVPGKSQQPAAAPSQPTREQMQSAFVGQETVKVRAGTFTADHYRYDDPKSGTKGETWISKTVPGYMVKFLGTDAKDGSTSSGELIEIERGVTTALGSF
jgi:hypothetical protein